MLALHRRTHASRDQDGQFGGAWPILGSVPGLRRLDACARAPATATLLLLEERQPCLDARLARSANHGNSRQRAVPAKPALCSDYQHGCAA
jgi:hypothetical protein